MMSRKSLFEMSRQGRMKRIKKAISLENQSNCNLPGTTSNDDNARIMNTDDNAGIMNNESYSSDSTTPFFHLSSINCPTQTQSFSPDNPFFDEFISKDHISDSEDDEHLNENDQILVNLKEWALKHKVTHVAISDLLTILKKHHCFSLPVDARTLLKTPRTVLVRSVEPGEYSHIGLEFNLKKIITKVPEGVNEISLLIGIDGLPLFKSCASEFWPILGSISNIESLKSCVFPIGVYYGAKKPASPVMFLQEFVSEVIHLINNGLYIGGKQIKVEIKGFLCDAPAKAYILGVKNHPGYSSCTKCKQAGIYINHRVTFPDCDAPLRTHEDFLNYIDKEFHHMKTELVNIPGIHFINSFPLDYMHLVCLGVVRTLIYTWVFGPVPLKLPHQIINSISNCLISLTGHIPSEFNRKPRSLDDVRRWKATEFRQFLLYTGPVVLFHVLKFRYKNYYEHFLTLSISMTILLNPRYCLEFNSYAKNLLQHFIKTFMSLYGPQFATHNLHGLTHISDDVITFGSLENCSAFQFENFLQFFKKSVRKADKPLQQIVKRLGELNNTSWNSATSHTFPHFAQLHSSGILLPGCDASRQYRLVELPSFEITISSPNSCCILKDGSIVVVSNIVFSKNSNSMVILCREFLSKDNFFKEPLIESSVLGIYIVQNLSGLSERPIVDIVGKIMLLPFKDNHVAIPLLHTN